MGVGTPERLIDELVRQSKRNLTHKLAPRLSRRHRLQV